MPFPTLINGDANGLVQPATYGPYIHGTDYYVLILLVDLITELAVYKSTDGGVTWDEVDAGNRKTLDDTALYSCCSNLDGSKLYAGYLAAAGPHYTMDYFDTSTDAWAGVDAVASDPPVMPVDAFTTLRKPCSCYRASDSAVLWAVEGDIDAAAAGDRLLGVISVYTDGAGWGAWQTFPYEDVADPGSEHDWTCPPWGMVSYEGLTTILVQQLITPNTTFDARVYQVAFTDSNTFGTYTEIASLEFAVGNEIQLPLPLSIAVSTDGAVRIAVGGTIVSTPITQTDIILGTGASADPVTFTFVTKQVSDDDATVVLASDTPALTADAFGQVYCIYGYRVDNDTGLPISAVYRVDQGDGSGFGDVVQIGDMPDEFFGMNRLLASALASDVGFTFIGSQWFWLLGGVVPPPPVVTATSPPIGGGGDPILAKPNALDNCLYWYRRLVSRIEWPKLAWPVTDSPYPSLLPEIMPVAGMEFRKQGTLSLPQTEGTDILALSFRVPQGYYGLINGCILVFTGLGFAEGSGDIIWRAKNGNAYVRGFQAVQMQLGSFSIPYQLPSWEECIPNQTVEVYVRFGSGSMGRLSPNGVVVCVLTGWFVPQPTIQDCSLRWKKERKAYA